MRIIVKSTGFRVTPSILEYIDKKLGSLGRFIKKFEKEGELELKVEIGKITHHHHKGLVFRTEANLHLPPKHILRAESLADSLQAAIDEVKDIMRNEIKKFKERILKKRRISRRKGR